MKTKDFSSRAGTYIKQAEGFKAFVPKPLPPEPSIVWDNELHDLLSQADRALGRLDGTAFILPDPDIFVAMYVKKEAVLSSQIEGTQASLMDILDYESTGEIIKDVDEIVNYIKAMNRGLERLKELPLSLRLIKEIHEELLKGVRGMHRSPGEFRRTQNWIGSPGATVNNAAFVPPPPHLLLDLLGDLETYIHEKNNLPALIKNALVHAQFETIHPFLDGNGRIGRLLITFLLVHEDILQKPLLYLSYYFKRNRDEYYDRLNGIRVKGDWEGWLKFFLKGIYEVSKEATDTAKSIIGLQELHRANLENNPRGIKLLEHLFTTPIVTINDICRIAGISNATAGRLVKHMTDKGILKEITGYARNRRFLYKDYFDILKKGTEGR